MFTVYKKKVDHTGYDFVMGYFDTIEDIWLYFSKVYKRYKLAERFSHMVNEPYGGNEFCSIPEYCMYVVNDAGIRLSRDTLRGEFYKIYKPHDYPRFPSWGRNHHYRGFRHIRTTQERRASVHVLAEEGEPPFRAARNTHNLPNYWDDMYHSDWGQKNWKRFRKTQWK